MANAAASRIQPRSAASVLSLAGTTVTNPFIGRPVRSNTLVCRFLRAFSARAGPRRRTNSSFPHASHAATHVAAQKECHAAEHPLLAESLATGQHFTDSSRQLFIIGHGRTSGEESGSDFPLVVFPQPRAHFGSEMPLPQRALCLPRPPRVRRGLSRRSP